MNKNALTLHPNNKTLFLAPFVPGTATQMWTYNASTYQLSVMKLCLSTPPIKTYAQVCGRISSYNGFDATTTPGYCFSVNKVCAYVRVCVCVCVCVFTPGYSFSVNKVCVCVCEHADWPRHFCSYM